METKILKKGDSVEVYENGDLIQVYTHLGSGEFDILSHGRHYMFGVDKINKLIEQMHELANALESILKKPE